MFSKQNSHNRRHIPLQSIGIMCTYGICRPSVDRVSVDISANTRSIRVSVAMLFKLVWSVRQYVSWHLADTSTITLRSTIGGILVDCRWYIGGLLVVYQLTVVGICVLSTTFLLKWKPSPSPSLLLSGDAKEESITYAQNAGIQLKMPSFQIHF